jgi:hypothetical protein
MINIKINKYVIYKMNPCKDRFYNYLVHYSNFEGSLLEFLDLEHISPEDKIWVTIRLLPRELVEYFAIDWAFASSNADASTADAYIAAYEAASNAERQNQVEVLKYLVENA